MVTEYVSGGELFDYLVEKPKGVLSEAEVSGIVRQVANALAYLHKEVHVIHRDVKLENILVSRRPVEDDGEIFPLVKLIDFGLAKQFTSTTSQTVTSSGKPFSATTYFGTQGYIAPEMDAVRKSTGYSYGVDVWALGVLTYVLLCGVFPFESSQAMRSGGIKYPPWCSQYISPSAKELVSKLLCVDPNKRLTASRACVHEWIAGATASTLALLGTPQMLDKYRVEYHHRGGHGVEENSTSAANAVLLMDGGVSPLCLDVQQQHPPVQQQRVEEEEVVSLS